MDITKAQTADFETVRNITRETISTVYPHYYPAGAVDFFLEHHCDENILGDIKAGCVYICTDKGTAAGTVTVRENEILRLFVLPQYQGHGCGRELLNFAEALIARDFHEIIIDASLAAKPIYLKRGYKETGYNSLSTANGDFLCYDIMKKRL